VGKGELQSVLQVYNPQKSSDSVRAEVLQGFLTKAIYGATAGYFKTHKLIVKLVKFELAKYRRLTTTAVVTKSLPNDVQLREDRKTNLMTQYSDGSIDLKEFVKEMIKFL